LFLNEIFLNLMAVRLYLAVVLELYSRRVMGWAIAERMTAALVCEALLMALWRQRMPKV
jgi:putative transposase